MTHTSTEQPEALRLIEWFEESGGFCQGTKAHHKWVLQAEQELRRLHTRVQELEASQEHLKNALEDIASGEITRSHCVGPHCTEDVGLATADEMASRAAGALHWHGITQEKQG